MGLKKGGGCGVLLSGGEGGESGDNGGWPVLFKKEGNRKRRAGRIKLQKRPTMKEIRVAEVIGIGAG